MYILIKIKVKKKTKSEKIKKLLFLNYVTANGYETVLLIRIVYASYIYW